MRTKKESPRAPSLAVFAPTKKQQTLFTKGSSENIP
jgi:hypothetical protein